MVDIHLTKVIYAELSALIEVRNFEYRPKVSFPVKLWILFRFSAVWVMGSRQIQPRQYGGSSTNMVLHVSCGKC